MNFKGFSGKLPKYPSLKLYPSINRCIRGRHHHPNFSGRRPCEEEGEKKTPRLVDLRRFNSFSHHSSHTSLIILL